MRLRTVVIAVIAGTVIVAALAVSGTLLIIDRADRATATAASPAPAASPTYDPATLAACKHAKDSSDTTDYESSLDAARSARASAGLSNVDALREAADKFSGNAPFRSPIDNANALSTAYTVSAWCITNHVPESM